MMNNMEKLLRLVADYHSFCGDGHMAAADGDDELSLEELDFVAAAGTLEGLDGDAELFGLE